MKYIVTALFSLISMLSMAQIKLTSFPVELKRNAENQQMINFVDEKTNEIYTFVTDKETVTGIKLNSAVFVSDSISTAKPFNYHNVIGYSFSANNSPIIHWITEDNKKIKSIEYDFSKETKDFTATEITFSDETIVTSFSNKGIFYVLTDNRKNDLKLYEFGAQNTNTTLKSSDLNFTNNNNDNIKISQVLTENPLARMETDFYNPLMATAQKVKFYLEDDTVIFTFDLNVSTTEVVEIDLNSKLISKKEFPQSKMDSDANQSNSFYLHHKLFQVQSNENQLDLSIVACKSNTVLKHYSLSENENSFPYSTFLIQSEQYKAETMGSLKRFLRKVDNSHLSFSIFPVNNTYIASFGSNKTSASSSGIALGISVGLGVIIAGGDFVNVGGFTEDRTQSVYLDFDCDENFNIIPANNVVLATSIVNGFLADKDTVRLYQTFRYRDYFVLSYYDKKAKEIVLYKFQNNF
ncbi:hypothetical protein [Flavobacterium sp.]